MKKQQICYGQDVWVWTFTGWEKWDWNSPAFESIEDAFEALADYSRVRVTPPN